jgi:nitrate reductase alpha subunit
MGDPLHLQRKPADADAAPRGGPIVWISETDAKELGIEDNDWIEAFNANGALTARAVVSQRVPPE